MPRRLIAAYLAVVVALAITRALWGHPAPSSFALTPDRLGHGKVWLFVTSAVIVNGPPLLQILALIPTVITAERRLGAGFVGVVMIAAHVGATLLAYAVLATFTGDADGAHNSTLDYGTSAVWLGTFGALTVALLPAARRGSVRARAVVALGVVAFVVGSTAFALLPATEHGLAFAIGGAAAAATGLRSAGCRSVRSGASTASGRAGSA